MRFRSQSNLIPPLTTTRRRRHKRKEPMIGAARSTAMAAASGAATTLAGTGPSGAAETMSNTFSRDDVCRSSYETSVGVGAATEIPTPTRTTSRSGPTDWSARRLAMKIGSDSVFVVSIEEVVEQTLSFCRCQTHIPDGHAETLMNAVDNAPELSRIKQSGKSKVGYITLLVERSTPTPVHVLFSYPTRILSTKMVDAFRQTYKIQVKTLHDRATIDSEKQRQQDILANLAREVHLAPNAKSSNSLKKRGKMGNNSKARTRKTHLKETQKGRKDETLALATTNVLTGSHSKALKPASDICLASST